jgi:hypothetical protein
MGRAAKPACGANVGTCNMETVRRLRLLASVCGGRGKTCLNKKFLAACAGYACFGTRRRRHADACILILVVIATPVDVEYFYTITALTEKKSLSACQY